eukprot:363649-Chlamydomonas_euryale.AAC.10
MSCMPACLLTPAHPHLSDELHPACLPAYRSAHAHLPVCWRATQVDMSLFKMSAGNSLEHMQVSADSWVGRRAAAATFQTCCPPLDCVPCKADPNAAATASAATQAVFPARQALPLQPLPQPATSCPAKTSPCRHYRLTHGVVHQGPPLPPDARRRAPRAATTA